MKLLDLSVPLVEGSPAFPGDPVLRLAAHATVAADGCAVTRIEMSSHQGTHADAPAHVIEGGMAIDAVPLDRFHGPAALVDLAPGAALAPGTAIGPEMLEPHAAAFVPGGRVLYRTGWDRRRGTPGFFEECPSLTVDAARWIACRGIALLGLDAPTPAVDWKEVHLILLGAGIVLLEGLRGLERLPPRFTLIAFPLAIAGGDGAPVRAVAIPDS